MKRPARRCRRHERSALALATLLAASGAERVDAGEAAANVVAAPANTDLAHPTYTAQKNLDALLVDPAEGGVAASSSAAFEIRTDAGTGVELRVNDTTVPLTRIGKRTVDNTTGETRYFFYGITLLPGRNTVSVTALGADGRRGTPRRATVFGPGPATNLDIRISGPMHADGQSENTVSVVATDAWGHPALSGTPVRIELLTGDGTLDRFATSLEISKALPAQLPVAAAGDLTHDADVTGSQPVTTVPPPSQRFTEVTLAAGGIAKVRFMPGLVAGNVDIRATSGRLESVGRFFLGPNIRKPIVNGIFTAGVGAIPGDPAAALDQPDGVDSRRARVAIYATGALDEKTLATLAYDTANRLERSTTTGAFVDDPNERPYTNYGDASLHRDDALSRDHLFFELNRGRNALTWGEFNASTSPTTDTSEGYTQLVDGAQLKLAGAGRSLSAFAAQNDVAYDRRVFAPTALSSTGQLLFPNIVVGSETVTLVSLDRRTGAIVTQSTLAPNVDYVLDDAGGAFRFINIPLPFDDAGNPQQVVLTYEYASPGNGSRTIGGRTEIGLRNGIRLGAGYVNDSTGAGNMSLLNADVTGRLKNGNWSIVNVVSRGSLGFANGIEAAPGGGDALHAQLATTSGANSFNAVFSTTTAGFLNPFGGLSTPGLVDARASFTHRLADGAGDITLSADHQANAGVNAPTSQSQFEVHAHRTLWRRLGIAFGLIRENYRGGAAAAVSSAAPLDPSGAPAARPPSSPQQSDSTLATLAISDRIGSRLIIDASRTQNIGGTASLSEPDQTQLQAGYRLGDAGRAFVRQTFSAAPTQSFAASTVGLTSAAAATRSTEIGIERTLSPTLSADSEYLVERTGNGSDLYAALGVRERLIFSPALRGDAYLQHANAAGTNVTGFTAYGASLAYGNAATGFHSTASLQQRNGGAGGTTYSLAAAGPLSPDVSLFATVLGSRTAGFDSNDARVGIAWRGAASDRNVTLAQYERIGGASELTSSRSGIVSIDQFFRPDPRTELSARYAYKLDGDATYAAKTSLLGLRADRKIGARFDVGFEVRKTFAAAISGSQTLGAAVETGLRLGDRMRLAVGYNFRQSGDAALSLSPAKCGFYFTVTSVVDRLFGWGGRH